eukprot:SAG22_NODE_6_length_41368_cov_49.702222_19_plen_274_part_00
MVAAAAAALLSIQPASAFYLPGVAPLEYKDGDPVSASPCGPLPSRVPPRPPPPHATPPVSRRPSAWLQPSSPRLAVANLPCRTPPSLHQITLKNNKLSSTKTALPYEYYQLPFCKPDTVKTYAENLGEVLRGDRIESSKYELSMKHDEYCKFLCGPKYTQDEIKEFSEKIMEEYRVNMIVDNLPAATKFLDQDQNTVYSLGFPLGFVGDDQEASTKPGAPRPAPPNHALALPPAVDRGARGRRWPGTVGIGLPWRWRAVAGGGGGACPRGLVG